MKVAPLYREIRKRKLPIRHLICHTGQHYDKQMSDVFFKDLDIPSPDFNLNVGSGSHAKQTAKIMDLFEDILLREFPDMIIVVGDVNSTLACSLVATKLGIPIAHVEAGLRSFDRSMPEEINRKLTDAVSDILFVSEPSGLKNLKREGLFGFGNSSGRKEDNRILKRLDRIPLVAFVGNIMIDNLIYHLPRIERSDVRQRLGLKEHPYLLVTFHRPQNVDDSHSLARIIELLNRLSSLRRVVFPIHPRTRDNAIRLGLEKKFHESLVLLEPLGYLDFMALMKQADLVITDSGGIQEETTVLGIQCVTARDSTERPVTVDVGTNHLVGSNIDRVEEKTIEILSGRKKRGKVPKLWDGRTAERIVDILVEAIGGGS